MKRRDFLKWFSGLGVTLGVGVALQKRNYNTETPYHCCKAKCNRVHINQMETRYGSSVWYDSRGNGEWHCHRCERVNTLNREMREPNICSYCGQYMQKPLEGERIKWVKRPLNEKRSEWL